VASRKGNRVSFGGEEIETSASIAAVRAKFDEYLKASAAEPVLLTHRGKPVAVLYGSFDKDDLERLRVACDPQFQKIVADAERRFRQGRGIPHDEFWARVEQKHPDAFDKKPKTQRKQRRTGS